MKNIFLLIIFVFVIFSFLTAKVIAKVGDYEISDSDLSDKISQLPDSLQQKKQIAYSLLVNDALFLNYAKENGITVSENELDDFFISQLGDDPSLQTNGEFDYNKFIKLKESEKGKKLLQLMKRDILIKKSKDLIIQSFELTDQNLLNQFILNSLKVDLDYAIMNIDFLNFSSNCSIDKAKEFFFDNRTLFTTKPARIFRFSVQLFSNFSDSAKVLANIKLSQLPDSLYQNTDKDSIFTKIYTQILDSLTYNSAIKDYIKFRSSKDDSIHFFDTYPVSENNKFDQFPPDSLKNINLGDVSLPFKTKYGFVTLKYLKFVQPHYLPLEKVKYKVWKDYLKICNNNLEEAYQFYKTNIDSFYTSASLVKILKISKKNKRLNLIQENFFNEKPMKHQEIQEKIIFLKKYQNSNSIYDLIAKKINKATEKGVVEDNDNYYFFIEIVNFPNYLPDFEDIKNQINYNNSYIDTTLIRKYYEENKRNLVSSDSVQLGYAFFPFRIDTLTVDDNIVFEYYKKHKKEFKRDIPSIKFDYIAVPDSETAKNLYKYLVRGDDFDFLKKLYNVGCNYFKSNEMPIKAMNDTIKNIFYNTPLKSYSLPFYFRDKWLIIYKKEFYNREYKTFSEVKSEIEKKFKLQEAKKIAQEQAKIVFDSTSYFSQCKIYVEKKNIRKTKFQSIEEKFDILGDMSIYKDELMRIWKNVKLTSIVETDSGYAVVYLLKKKYSHKLTYEEAKPKIVKILLEEKKLKKAFKNAKLLRESIINGADPDSLLFFIGKWYRGKNIKLNSNLPGMNSKLSSLILSDVSKHKNGYISPILKLNLKQLIFYKINKLEKISKTEFYKNKNKIKSDLIKKMMKKWITEYKKKVDIRFYGY